MGNLAPIIPEHDYLSGEAEMLVDAGRSGTSRICLGRQADPLNTHLPEARFVPGTRCQWHCLLPVDCFLGHGNPPPTWLPEHPYKLIEQSAGPMPMEPPLYSDAQLGSFLKHCLSVGGAVTLNVGISQEGRLGQEAVRQLQRLAARA